MPYIKNIDVNNAKFNNIITSNNALLKLFCTLTVTVITCILIGHYAFKNGMLTCNNYVLNTYLYIILSILLMFMVVLINDKFGLFNSNPLLAFCLASALVLLGAFLLWHLVEKHFLQKSSHYLVKMK